MTRRHAIELAFSRYVDASRLAGAAALIWRNGNAEVVAVGKRDLSKGLPVERDTIFRIASMTKPVTTVAALAMLDDGLFELDEPITRVAPELGRMRVLRHPDGPLEQTDEASRPITFRDLLTHRSGLTYGDFHHGPIGAAYADTLGAQIDNVLTPDEWIARLSELPLVDQPGAGFHYGVSSDLLGFLVARLDQAPLGEVLDKRVFAHLGMRDTGFAVSPAKQSRRAGLCGFDRDGHLVALAMAPGGHAMSERPPAMTFESGGQGLYSTLDDYLMFARTLIGDGSPLLRFETRTMMTSSQLTPKQRKGAQMLGQAIFAEGHSYGMGVAVVVEPEKADRLRCRGTSGTIGWPGAYGGWWQADPKDGSVLIFLSHNMLDLQQMARGIGLGVWGAIGDFHEIATA
jgi:CubicO group peptidase (beta-lactamase class C family)